MYLYDWHSDYTAKVTSTPKLSVMPSHLMVPTIPVSGTIVDFCPIFKCIHTLCVPLCQASIVQHASVIQPRDHCGVLSCYMIFCCWEFWIPTPWLTGRSCYENSNMCLLITRSVKVGHSVVACLLSMREAMPLLPNTSKQNKNYV